ncbi:MULTISPECIES: DUF4747 family protein [unclassified Mucilaginibacter]|uniref:DUF4747 family protein n=1 Tax=unclassified Mucilaginibacter TaxID=2617802 RepID=UPI002AC91817|nr:MULTISPECIES: DUF4747 family protein [unclassified Mucilaginibacter]MEB0263391.1 DUF4747 family protein [Mucilaginibacter sp. 10I4]MEB0278580.1 DUF4747 family protein [Mucilaginibacter sp. 10B2]MEB0299290.1 DUF4747 family protein [Mucilaginibacter sp. 5C4]WPX23465.1 DUF4747 family protein [Mucilaginibacter sp. 5C4]
MVDKILHRAFFTINIKLRKENNNRDATREEYIHLIRKVYSRKIHKPSSSGKHCIIKYLLDHKENDVLQFLHGKVAQFTYFENKSWFDIGTLDIDAQFHLRDGLFPDAVETDFIFDPDKHKFSFITKSSIAISPYPLRTFWEEALNSVKEKDEYIHVDVVTSQDFSEKLYKARVIKRLEIDLNYSNSGIGSISKEVIDTDFKKTNAKNATIIMVAKKSETLNINDSEIIKGALELSEEDGEAKAKIVDEAGNLVDISTRQFPKKDFFDSNEIHFLSNFFAKIRNIWPLN